MIEHPKLPYEISALEPHVSAQTLEIHHGKHHKAYVDKLNAAIGGTQLDGEALESIVQAASESGQQGIFNNAAQAWNHAFLWHSMSPTGGGEPTGALADAIKRDFGGIEKFRNDFKQAALGQFGSGWAWLVANEGRLKIVSTGNADTPLTGPDTPLLTLDVWEHAYYLDFQNQRDRYVDVFLSNLIHWDFASRNFDAA